jgi:ubiquinone/menaquinone biosynthesis C-methylase UbiE/DNA-binding transcriptional ArsR family regulator
MRLLGDATRLRIWMALRRGALTVAELQEVLDMGQSRISAQLALLKRAGMVTDRKDGKHSYYAPAESEPLEAVAGLAARAAAEIPETSADAAASDHVLRKRRDRMRAHFDTLAGKFGRDYVPGRSWKSLAEALLTLLPPLEIADLGAGEGTLSQLLARRAKRVVAIDNSEKMVEYGTRLAAEHGLANLEYRLGDIEAIPLPDDCIDLAVFSQALHHAVEPLRALREARRILRPGGRVLVLDLLHHRFSQARERYGDVWLGFREVELLGFLRQAGFNNPECATVDRESGQPGFQTILATALMPTPADRPLTGPTK